MEADYHILLILKVPCAYIAINSSLQKSMLCFFPLPFALLWSCASQWKMSSKRSPLVCELVLAGMLWYSLAIALPGSVVDMRFLIEQHCRTLCTVLQL